MLRLKSCYTRKEETGSVLLMVAGGMVMLLAVCAIAIDLANFYLARAQAQRAADAAALAGAKAFVTSGCTTGGCSSGGIQETIATQQAEAAAAQNYVAGKPATLDPNSDIAFSYPTPEEPQITVTVQRSVPTFFAKIFGIPNANVSAKASAEAYNPSGGGNSSVGVACLKPFLVPNCDPGHPSPSNGACADSGGGGYFFYPGTPGTKNTVENPGPYSQGGIIGETWQLHTDAAPSQWYLVGFTDATWESGSALENHIVECTPGIFACGDTLQTANGVKEGKVMQGIETLIDATGPGLGMGQDSIDTTTGPPFPITGGYQNPNPLLRNKVFYDYSESPSVMTVPVYEGGALTPGQDVVSIVGYLQVFVTQVESASQKAIDMVILNASTCGGTPGGTTGTGGGPIVATAGSPIPIRLIRTN